MFRFPKAIVDPKWFHPYDLPDAITITQTAKYVVLDIEIREENGLSGWTEGEGWMSSLLPLRDELMSGDVRLLYLVWLRTAPYLAGNPLDDDPIEPPIPPNLGQLSKPLQAFTELVELDADWVTAAAQASPQHQPPADAPLENALSALSEAERQEYLLKLVRREPHVDLQLINRLKELAGADRAAPASTPGQRKLSELQAIAEALEKKREAARDRNMHSTTRSTAKRKRP